jgi:hypothetical protein
VGDYGRWTPKEKVEAITQTLASVLRGNWGSERRNWCQYFSLKRTDTISRPGDPIALNEPHRRAAFLEAGRRLRRHSPPCSTKSSYSKTVSAGSRNAFGEFLLKLLERVGIAVFKELAKLPGFFVGSVAVAVDPQPGS